MPISVMKNEILKELAKHNVWISIDEMEYDVADESSQSRGKIHW